MRPLFLALIAASGIHNFIVVEEFFLRRES